MRSHWEIRRRERLDGVSHLLTEVEGKSVLDLGCNRGLVCYEFAVAGAAYVSGVDKNEQAIATARHLFDDVTTCRWKFAHRDLVYGLPYDEEVFDFILLLGVYHKLRRVMNQKGLNCLVAQASHGVRTFVWNGFPEEFALINDVLKSEFDHDYRVANVQQWCVWRRR